MIIETLLVGLVVGLVLGATGAGGSIFAVPLFIIFLGLSINDAMGVALGAVSVAAAVGIMLRNKSHQGLDWRTGLTLATSGALTAPIGRTLAGLIDDQLLLTGFTLLALTLAVRMWRQAHNQPEVTYAVRSEARLARPDTPSHTQPQPPTTTAYRSEPTIMVIGGLLVGLLSGLFGVGGGFLIVPLLTLYIGMGIKQAVGTSLIVISVVSAAGFIAHLLNQSTAASIPTQTLLYTCLGSVAGIISGTVIFSKVSGPRLQKLFAIGVIGLMAVSLLRNVL